LCDLERYYTRKYTAAVRRFVPGAKPHWRLVEPAKGWYQASKSSRKASSAATTTIRVDGVALEFRAHCREGDFLGDFFLGLILAIPMALLTPILKLFGWTEEGHDRRSEQAPSLRVAIPGTADREFRYVFDADDVARFARSAKAAG
jgi:hypothetical protein